MIGQPQPLLIFDVIETIFSLDPLVASFHKHGLPGYAKDLFFSQLLRDAFAVSATGEFKPFTEMARGTLEVVMANLEVCDEPEEVTDILAEFGRLPAHKDVLHALKVAKETGAKVLFLTNGSQANTEQLITQNGLSDWVGAIMSIETISTWKPSKIVYQEAIKKMGGELGSSTMIAAHAWDVQGAMAAGLRAGWIRRQDMICHPAMARPHFQGSDLVDLVRSVSTTVLRTSMEDTNG